MLSTLFTCTTHFIEVGTTAQHVQLVTELYLIFNKLEVGRLDSRLLVFVIILRTSELYHGVRLVVRIQPAFKTI